MILILDDEPQVVQQLGNIILDIGYKYDFLCNPEYLFDRLADSQVDLLLLDIYLPGNSGLKLLQVIKESDEYKNIPVVMLTADNDETLLAKCFEYGASDFINKPINELVLKSRINAVLTNKRILFELEKQKEKIEETLREKKTLLKEVHHRIKNNLQLVSSLLSLQIQNIVDSKLLNVFEEAKRRINIIAFLHEDLYNTEDLKNVNIFAYIQRIANNSIISNCKDPENIELIVDVENVSLETDTAIPCGLIINELITNSIKHAFKINEKGSITIQLKSGDNNQFILKVNDTGSGISNDIDYENTNTFGFKLVRLFVAQLEGNLEIEFDEGTQFIIKFKNPAVEEGIQDIQDKIPEKIRVLIVEDETVIAQHLSEVVEDFGYVVTNILSSGEKAIKEVSKNPPDIILMDIVLKGKINGIVAAERIYNIFKIPVIFLTAYSDKFILNGAMKTKPFGFILKPFKEKDLYVNIHMALYRSKLEKNFDNNNEDLDEYLTSKVGQLIQEYNHKKGSGLINQLTPKEKEILHLIVEGVSTRDIAQRLFRSERTIETHRRNIMKKLNLSDVGALVRFAIDNKVL